MKKTLLKKYAKLIARVGANVRKGQKVIVYSEAEFYEFTPLVVDECYKAGASCVTVEWRCQPVTKLSYRNRTLRSLSEVPEWQKAKLELMTEELPCRIHLIGEDPDGIKGVNVDKMQKVNIAVSKVTKPYRDRIENRHQWTIAAVPSVAWAKKVFPNERKNAAVEKLWKQILSAVRVTEDNDPAAAWEEHNKTFAAKSKFLNDCKFDTIEYKSSNGTDLRVGLMPQGVWHGGNDTTLSGTAFNPNLPTEEIFTSPMKGKAEGRVVSTKPLSYQGHIIDNFRIDFKDGKAVAWQAEKGEDLLGKMLTTDEGAAYIGELALIPCNSPINNSGVLFYETLFDENASCHIAMGMGFADCVENFENIGLEGCRELGLNDSVIHVDFMIGSPDLCITGYKNGKATPIFVNGEWA